MQDLMAWPFEITVHEPHWPRPQPNLGPRSSRSSLRTNSRGVAGSTSTVRERPFTFSVRVAMAVRIPQVTLLGATHASPPTPERHGEAYLAPTGPGAFRCREERRAPRRQPSGGCGR